MGLRTVKRADQPHGSFLVQLSNPLPLASSLGGGGKGSPPPRQTGRAELPDRCKWRLFPPPRHKQPDHHQLLGSPGGALFPGRKSGEPSRAGPGGGGWPWGGGQVSPHGQWGPEDPPPNIWVTWLSWAASFSCLVFCWRVCISACRAAFSAFSCKGRGRGGGERKKKGGQNGDWVGKGLHHHHYHHRAKTWG